MWTSDLLGPWTLDLDCDYQAAVKIMDELLNEYLFQKHTGEKWRNCSHCRLWSGGEIQQRHRVSGHLSQHQGRHQTIHGSRDSQQLLERQLFRELQGGRHLLCWSGVVGGCSTHQQLRLRGACRGVSASILWCSPQWSLTPGCLPSSVHQTDQTSSTSPLAELVSSDTSIYHGEMQNWIFTQSTFIILNPTTLISKLNPFIPT